MDTKKLETFLALAQEKTYARTAMKLDYAPATLIGHIQSLENELGTKLICRRGNQSVLTEKGETFLPYARKIIEIQHEAYIQMQKNNEKQVLRVSTSQSLGQYVVGDLLREFSATHNDCDLQVNVGNCADFVKHLLNDKTDICFTYTTVPLNINGIQSVPLFEEDIYLIVHPAHPLAQKKMIDLLDLAGQRFSFVYGNCCYTSSFLNQLKNKGIKLGSYDYLGSVEMIKRCALNNHGIALIPACVTDKERKDGRLVALQWSEKPLRAQAELIFRPHRVPNQRFLHLLIEFIKKRYANTKNKVKAHVLEDSK